MWHTLDVHLTGAWILLIFSVVVTATMLLLLHRTQAGGIIHTHIADRPRRRMFLASVAHHLVWGILILLVVGYGFLGEVDNGDTPTRIFCARLLSILYGVGAALTLDEFALWLNLRDVYWAREGRTSIDAVVLFGSLLAIGAWGAPLLDHFREGKHHDTSV